MGAVKMREIASLPGGPISSIYQYFPNKSAMVATLHDRWSSDVYDMLEEGLKGVDSLETLFIASAATLRQYHLRLLSDSAMVGVLSAVQADKTLNTAYVQAIRKLAHLFVRLPGHGSIQSVPICLADKFPDTRTGAPCRPACAFCRRYRGGGDHDRQ